MADVLIVGCGDVGVTLGAALSTKGHRVIGLNRSGESAGAPFEFVRADVTDESTLSPLGFGYDAVFYTAAPGDRTAEAYEAVYERGLENLLGHFDRGARTPTVFLTTSTAVYGQTGGEVVDEGSRTEPTTFSGKALLRAEKLLAGAGRGNVSVRLGGIYGPGRDWLIGSARGGEPVQKDPPYYTNRIHRDDCAGVLAHLFELDEAGKNLSPCYVAVDDDPAPMWDVITWLRERERLGPPPEKIASTDAPMNKQCDNRLLKSAGYEFLFRSYKEGYLGLTGSSVPG